MAMRSSVSVTREVVSWLVVVMMASWPVGLGHVTRLQLHYISLNMMRKNSEAIRLPLVDVRSLRV